VRVDEFRWERRPSGPRISVNIIGFSRGPWIRRSFVLAGAFASSPERSEVEPVFSPPL